MKSVLLTGASGFIGGHFLSRTDHLKVVTFSFRKEEEIRQAPFEGHEVVLHLAGIAHRMDMPSGQLYYDVNHKMTIELARRAKEAGVSHFIFMSSIKVYGNDLQYIEENTSCVPDDDYGKSKYLAENELKQLETPDFAVTILRIPVVYGAGVKGNIEKVISLCQKGVPIPLGNIANRRSMIYVGNLIKYLHFLIENRQTGVFIPTDANPISTSDLVGGLLNSFGKSKQLWPFPKFMYPLVKLIRPGLYQRLFCSFEVDSSFYEALQFQMPYGLSDGIAEMV